MAIRILFLTCHLPAPPYSGGRRREFELTTRLAHDFEVHVWAVTKTLDEDREHAPAFAGGCAGVRLFAAAPQPCTPAVPPQVARHACPGIARPLARALD